MESLRADARLDDVRLTVRKIYRQPGWYADFRSPTETFVVFPGRIFRYPRGEVTGRAAAEAHGRILGVPGSQLDWPT